MYLAILSYVVRHKLLFLSLGLTGRDAFPQLLASSSSALTPHFVNEKIIQLDGTRQGAYLLLSATVYSNLPIFNHFFSGGVVCTL